MASRPLLFHTQRTHLATAVFVEAVRAAAVRRAGLSAQGYLGRWPLLGLPGQTVQDGGHLVRRRVWARLLRHEERACEHGEVEGAAEKLQSATRAADQGRGA